MKKISCLLLCIILVLGSVSVCAAGAYDKAAARILSLRIINTQEPSATLTRGEAIFALMRLYIRGEMSVTGTPSVFSDVAQDDMLAPYSDYAYQMGFVSGMGDGRLAPEEGISLQQFIKIAVCVLGYRNVAESEGGYPGGYIAVANTLGILKNVPSASGALTYEHAVLIIDNMLDAHPLEPVYGTDRFQKSELTLYEMMQSNEDLYVISGLVTAVGKMALGGHIEMNTGEISVEGLRMKYEDFDDEALLGRYVTAYYRYGSEDAIPVAVSIHIERRNEEITVDAKDITKLDVNECVYTEEDGKRTHVLRFDAPQTIYNGRWHSSPVKPVAGSVTALDYDSDGKYELIFIDEYESFIVERTLAITDAIYFKEGFTFRGKNSITFDFDDDDMEYEFLSKDMETMTFSDISEGDVVSIRADMNEEKVRVIICHDRVEGVITSKDEENVGIGTAEYYVYEPNRADFMTKYQLGHSGIFALNHAGELIGVCGELDNLINYGYAVGFDPRNGLKPAQIRLVTPGSKEKKIKKSGNKESVSRVYTNGVITTFDLNSKVFVYAQDGTKTRISGSDLTVAQLDRAIVGYELDADGKIKALHNIQIASKKNYNKFNGEIHSYSNGTDAFFVGESTQVIFVPDLNSPRDEDFEKPFTVNDGNSENKLDRVAVDSETQIAECMVIFGDPAEESNFDAEDDDVSIVGKISVKIDSDGTEIYIMDVLTGETVEQVYIKDDSDEAAVAATLKKGDLIYYRANDDGKVRAIEVLLHLSYKLDNGYYLSKPGDKGETAYGKATYLRLNYLNAQFNERMDDVKLDVGNRETLYRFLRKDGPMFYIYNKNDRLIYPGVPEAIQEDVSDVFVYMGEANTPSAVVIVKH